MHVATGAEAIPFCDPWRRLQEGRNCSSDGTVTAIPLLGNKGGFETNLGSIQGHPVELPHRIRGRRHIVIEEGIRGIIRFLASLLDSDIVFVSSQMFSSRFRDGLDVSAGYPSYCMIVLSKSSPPTLYFVLILTKVDTERKSDRRSDQCLKL